MRANPNYKIIPVALALALLSLMTACHKTGGKLGYSDADSAWRYVRGDQSARGSSLTGEYSGKLDIIWQEDLSEKPQGPLALAHGRLIYTGAKRRLFFLDPDNGKLISKFKNRSTPQAGGLLIDSFLYQSSAPPYNYLDCYEITRGELQWRSQILDVSAPLVSYDSILFAMGGDGTVYALNRISGDLIWEYATHSKLLAAPALDLKSETATLWVARSDGFLTALNIESGEMIDETDLGEALVSGPAIGDRAVYVSGQGGSAFSLSRNDSALLVVNSYKLSSPSWSAPALADDYVIFADNLGNLYCFDTPEMNSPLWQVSLPGGLKADPIIVGNYVIAGLLNAHVIVLDLSTGEIVAQRTLDHEIKYAPVSDGSRIYIATQSSSLFCLGELSRSDSL